MSLDNIKLIAMILLIIGIPIAVAGGAVVCFMNGLDVYAGILGIAAAAIVAILVKIAQGMTIN